MKTLIIAATLVAAVFGDSAHAQTDNVYRLELNQGDSDWSAVQYFLHQQLCMNAIVEALNSGDWKPEQVRCVEVEMN